MSELFLVRHAQASFGSENYDRLSELGHQQARWLGEYFGFRNLEFDRLICGRMVRHLETAEGISTGMRRKLPEQVIDPDWDEFDFENLIRAYLCKYPAEQPEGDASSRDFIPLLQNSILAWSQGSLEETAPERWEDFEARVRKAVSAATHSRGKGQKVLVVSSGGAISMAIRQVLNTPPLSMVQMNLQTRNSGFSHLYYNDRGIRLSGFNHAPHLEHPERVDSVTYY